jgi:tripartite-type tricarboxylate transporter receptor subunit TctC
MARAQIEKVNKATIEALDDPVIRDRLEQQGFELYPSDQRTPEALAAIVKADIEKWWPIIKGANIRGE